VDEAAHLCLCANAQSVRHSLSILPSIRLGHVRSERIETKALVTERDALEVGVDPPRALLRVALDGASEETAFASESAEALALCQRPAAGDGAFWRIGGVCLGVPMDVRLTFGHADDLPVLRLPKSTSRLVDVDELTTGNLSAHGERTMTASEVGFLARRAVLCAYACFGTVGGGVLADPDLFTVGAEWLEMDGRARTGGDNTEELLCCCGGDQAGKGDECECCLHCEADRPIDLEIMEERVSLVFFGLDEMMRRMPASRKELCYIFSQPSDLTPSYSHATATSSQNIHHLT
jgi:hypothetical protein